MGCALFKHLRVADGSKDQRLHDLRAQHLCRFLRRHRVPEHPAAPFQPAEPRDARDDLEVPVDCGIALFVEGPRVQDQVAGRPFQRPIDARHHRLQRRRERMERRIRRILETRSVIAGMSQVSKGAREANGAIARIES